MLVDGLRLTSTAQVENTKIEADSSLPNSGLEEGRLFLLNTPQGEYNPGLYVYVNNGWMFAGGLKGIEAPEGSGLSVVENDGQVTISLSQSMTPYDIAAFVVGKPEDFAKVFRLMVVRPFNLPDGFSGSRAVADTPATGGSVSFDIRKNGVAVGSFVFAVGSANASITSSGAQSFVAGDLLELAASSTQNATLADISFTLAGNLQ